MNERIKELAAQADDYAAEYEFVNGGDEFDIFKQKFAELIVKECLNTVGHYANVDEGIAVAKKNFGVE